MPPSNTEKKETKILTDLSNNSTIVSDLESTGQSSSTVNKATSFGWRGINLSYDVPKSARKTWPSKTKQVLYNSSGRVTSGDMLAILGPSGAGKSCLLDIMAQRKNVGHIMGEIFIDDEIATPKMVKKYCSYVTQEDLFHPTQTVFEAIMYYADLRLDPKQYCDYKKKEICLKLIHEIGLQGKENQFVGGALPGGVKIRGLSGGEKRRLSIACGMVTSPSVLFLDEPTSGLDSNAAMMIMSLIAQYCKKGIMVLCTIHQPRNAIWDLFDKVLVMSDGRQLYFGEAKECFTWFSTTLDYPKHKSTTTDVDYILDLVNVNFTKDPLVYGEKTMQTKADVLAAATVFRDYIRESKKDFEATFTGTTSLKGNSILTNATESKSLKTKFFKWFHLFSVVFKRNLRNYIRNPGNAGARIGVHFMVAVIVSMTFWKLGEYDYGYVGVFNRMGALFTHCMTMILLPFASISLFMFDRQFYSAEAASKMYPASAYFVANLILEITLNSLCAAIYSIIVYYSIGFDPALIGAIDVNHTNHFLKFLLFIVVQSNMGAAMLQMCCLSVTQQDIAFAMAAGYVAVSCLASGMLMNFSRFGSYAKWIPYTSFFRYTFQGLNKNEFTGTKYERFIYEDMELADPYTIQGDILALIPYALTFYTVSYLCMKYLNRERR